MSRGRQLFRQSDLDKAIKVLQQNSVPAWQIRITADGDILVSGAAQEQNLVPEATSADIRKLL
jgi:hypothetical protein